MISILSANAAWADCRDKNACTNRRQFGAIRSEPGILRLRRTAWWGWEDSNFQPNDYQPLELNYSATGSLAEISRRLGSPLPVYQNTRQ